MQSTFQATISTTRQANLAYNNLFSIKTLRIAERWKDLMAGISLGQRNLSR